MADTNLVFQREYDWESIIDVEENIFDAINDSDVVPDDAGDGGFPGTLRVTVEYIEEEE